MKSSSGGHVVGDPVTSKAYGIEEKAPSARDGQSFRKADGDHLAVSLTNPSPYTSFGYKHSRSRSFMHAWPYFAIELLTHACKSKDVEAYASVLILQAAKVRLSTG